MVKLQAFEKLSLSLIALLPFDIAAAECPMPIAPPASNAPTLDELVGIAKHSTVAKDEFETTAQYEQRALVAAEKIPKNAITLAWPVTRLFDYDADNQTVTLNPYSESFTCLTFETALSPEAKGLTFGNPPDNIGGTVLGQAYCITRDTSRTTGKAYSASNSYGATVTVDPIKVQQIGLYFGYGSSGQDHLLEGEERHYRREKIIFNAPPEEARSLKTNGELLFVVQPTAPYYVAGSYYIEPKISSPTEISFNQDFLSAKLLCVAIADKSNGKIYFSKSVNSSK